jgi:hypothetical protein
VRNLSKNSLKKLCRPVAGSQPGYANFWSNYYFYNQGGARAYVQSKGRTNNLTLSGCWHYLTPAQRAEWQYFNYIV